MKKILQPRLFIFVLLLCLASASAAWADMKVKLTNKSTKKISVALRYKDKVSEAWVSRGWWSVDPLSVRTITISTNNTIAYFYATAGKSWWGAKKGENGAINLTIVGDKFLVKGDAVPKGNNRRNVWFRQMKAQNRLYSLSFQGD
ncbi:DUF1036 domain-containing protein [Desulfovibrio sp. OttesenSCG-928-M14]|nr:DUF1036 domain-containing protein [Desulfovibrio sp. OttesenSCG-928-M14]